MKYLKNIFNLIGTTGVRLKYGCENLLNAVCSVTMQSSQTLGAGGSYFITLDASGNGALTGAASTTIFGGIICGSGDVTSSTAGATVYPCNVGLDAVYRAPVGSGTYARSNRGKMCDLVVSSNIQKVATQTSTRSHVQLLDGDETNNAFVIVRINPAVISSGTAS